jgi:hypothetical protein
MSVNLTSKDGKIDEGISNGCFAAMVALARAYGEDVPAWDGTHDGHEYNPEHLRLIARRIRQLNQLTEILDDLAEHGGVIIS